MLARASHADRVTLVVLEEHPRTIDPGATAFLHETAVHARPGLTSKRRDALGQRGGITGRADDEPASDRGALARCEIDGLHHQIGPGGAVLTFERSVGRDRV